MTGEKLKLKCVTGGKHHRSSLTFHFECGDLHHQFVIKHVNTKTVALRYVAYDMELIIVVELLLSVE